MTDSFPKPDHQIRRPTTNNELLTSIENMTPPIGEPNATATPAALAAVKTSRLLPSHVQPHVTIRDGFGQAHSDCAKID
jgi:hypothetical protein